jgi:hypothetical protein
MDKRRLVLAAVGLTVLLATFGVWLAQRADAIIIVNSRTVDTGMFGITGDQFVRVHVVNASGFSADLPPCVVSVRFFDSTGILLGERQIKLVAGHAGFADLAQKVAPGERAHVRALVSQMVVGDFDEPVATCITTVEVVDRRSGQAVFIIDDGDQVR